LKRERALVGAAVVLLHAGFYFVVADSTHRKAVRPAPPDLVLLEPLPITPEILQHATAPPALHPHGVGPPSQGPSGRRRPGPRAADTESGPSASEPPSTSAHDWAADAAQAADQEVQAQVRREHQADGFAPRGQPLPSPEPRAPAFGWDESVTHRVQPVSGGLTVLHVNEQCGIVFYLVIPFMGACALDKPQARGDLFKHMHDPPQTGDWDARKKLP
jgi:hypothetical protein